MVSRPHVGQERLREFVALFQPVPHEHHLWETQSPDSVWTEQQEPLDGMEQLNQEQESPQRSPQEHPGKRKHYEM
ncbi:hypothetical protein CH252_04965 [Rhodococcus sp. 06-1477-1B]|nr:hypothetical protein CH252_04965 [Rhodococcus sp. 06-1477-1B]